MADSSEDSNTQQLVYWWEPRGEERVFDLSTWPEEAIAAVCALIDNEGLEHRWEERRLVVDAARRSDAATLLDEVVAASLPRLDADSDRTAYDLADWPDYEIEMLQAALETAGVLHEWSEDGELLVYEVDEARVDELFEQLDLRGPDPGIELDGEALTTLLTDLFVASDRLAADPDDADAVLDAHRSVLELQQLAVPYGMNPDGWSVLVQDAVELRRLIETEAGGGVAHTGGAGEYEAPGGEDEAPGGEDEAPAGEEAAPAVQLVGDEAIRALAARVRDHLKRVL